MSLARRLLAAERALGGPRFVTWAEFHAASERMRAALLAKCRALVELRPDPQLDQVQREADERIIEAWRRQEGIPESDVAAVRAKLLQDLRRMAGDPEWDWGEAVRRQKEVERAAAQRAEGS